MNAVSRLCLRTAGEVQPNQFRNLTFVLLFNNVKTQDLTGSSPYKCSTVQGYVVLQQNSTNHNDYFYRISLLPYCGCSV